MKGRGKIKSGGAGGRREAKAAPPAGPPPHARLLGRTVRAAVSGTHRRVCVPSHLPGTRERRAAIININNDNNDARPDPTYRQPRRSSPAAALIADLETGGGRALGTPARGGSPARPPCPAGPCGVLLSLQGHRQEPAVAAVQAAAARRPPPF